MTTDALLGEGRRIARKNHACVWCTGRIEAGDLHVWWTQKFDGVVSTTRCHKECERHLRDSADLDPDYLFCDERHERGTGCRHG